MKLTKKQFLIQTQKKRGVTLSSLLMIQEYKSFASSGVMNRPGHLLSMIS